MSLFRRSQPAERAASLEALRVLTERSSAPVGSVVVNQDTALRNSAVWACLRQRAQLLSTLPIDVFRSSGGVQVEVPKTPLLVAPGTDGQDIVSWLWATQFDLDRYGNAFGLVTERWGASGSFPGWPARIELLPAGDVVVRADGARVTEYRLGKDKWSIENGQIGQVWHERAFRPAGMAVGLNAVQMAAMTIGGYLSAQEFALNWFSAGGVPAVALRPTAKDLTDEQSEVAKRRWMNATASRGPAVLPLGWDIEMIDVPAASEAYMAEKQWSVTDVARYFDWPADLIDGAVSGSSVTYANIVERNLQALVMHLGPAVIRREAALSRALPAPHFVKLNTDSLLRMDPKAVSEKLGQEMRDRLRAPSEARKLINEAPFTPEQIAEFEALFGPPRQPSTTTGGGQA